MSHIDFIEKNLNYSEASLVSKITVRNLVNDWRDLHVNKLMQM